MLTTLGFRYPPGREPPVIAGIRQCFGGWPRVGRIVAGMARQQYDLQLVRFGQAGWQATFYQAGIGHSLTPMVGTGWAQPGRRVGTSIALGRGFVDVGDRPARNDVPRLTVRSGEPTLTVRT